MVGFLSVSFLFVELGFVVNSFFLSRFLTDMIVLSIGDAEYPRLIIAVRSLSACVRYVSVEVQMRRKRRHWL